MKAPRPMRMPYVTAAISNNKTGAQMITFSTFRATKTPSY